MKFTPEGGSVSLDVTETPGEDGKLVHLVFRVADTGIGISPRIPEEPIYLIYQGAGQQDRQDRGERSGAGHYQDDCDDDGGCHLGRERAG